MKKKRLKSKSVSVIKVKSKEDGYIFTIKRHQDSCGIYYGIYNASGELEGEQDTLVDAQTFAVQGGDRIGF